jgi:flagellar protein FliJ
MGKRAAFRLQPVLELRRTQERAAAQAAAQAANAAADADRQAGERETALVGAHPPE